MLKVALQNLRRHKLRTLFTAVAVALGVAFMAGTFVLTDTVSSSFDSIFTNANAGIDAQVRGRTAFESAAADGGDQRPNLDPAVLDAVRDVDGVAVAEPVIQGQGTVLNEDGDPLNSLGFSVGANWTGTPAIDVFTVVEGRAPEGPTEVVIDERTADAGDLAPGDPVDVLTFGGTAELEVVGTVRYGESGNLAGASFALMETSAAIDTFGFGDGKIQGVAVIATDGVSEDEVVERLTAALPDDVEAITAAAAAEEATEQVGSFVDSFRTFLTIFALIALAAGSFLIYNTFGIIVGQRVRELALLRALGAARSQVLRSVVVEAAVIGAIASVLGLLGGIALAVLLQTVLATTGLGEAGAVPVIAPRTIVASVLVGVVVSVLCAVIPAWRASKVAPVAALREVATDDVRRSVPRLVIGAFLVVAGIAGLVSGASGTGSSAVQRSGVGAVVLFAGIIVLGPVLVPALTGVLGFPLRLLGVAGTLGRDNARRNPRRSAGTAAALMLSVTLITLIAVVSQSFLRSINAATDEHFKGDLEVTGGGFGFPSLGPALVDGLASSEEVEAVTGVQRGTVELEGKTRPVYGVRFSDVEDVFDLGEVEGDLAGLGPDEIAVDRATARVGLWGLGKELAVTYPDGTTGVVTVGAIYDDGGIVAQNSDGHYLVSDQAFADHFPGFNQLLLRADVTAAEGVGVEQLRTVVERQADEFASAQVRDVDEIKRENNRQLTFSLAIFFALLGLALIIGALGVAITVALSVFERTREIGLLRAVGATRRQLVTSITAESILLTLLGTVLGLGIGIAGGIAIMRAQRDAFDTLRVFVSPVFVVGVLVLSVLIGVGASLIPGFRASRMDVLDAVTVE